MPFTDFDPWRFKDQTRPAPVEGSLQPQAILLEQDDELAARTRPLWLRATAALVAVGFLAFTVFTSYATGGAWSPITDAGDWRAFSGSLIAR